jgi:hypothetical protein
MNYEHSDYAEIVGYDSDTGIVTLDQNLTYYHFGAEKSTGDNNNFGGVDMRGEVILLSRNIKITGTDTDGWGC